ncbi:MAG: RNA polymerase factor sigma-54 [Phycisphaerae bacterium]|nr:RNA polymerase factor sigma-54 [Phycisphaerae bacterium]
MSQFLSQSLTQQMRLEQKLTPQLIQSMTILQKPVADLETFVNEALERNPALEIDEPEAPERGNGKRHHEHRRREERPRDEGFGRFDRFASDYEYDGAERAPLIGRRAGGDDRDAKMGALANTAGREISLQECLHNQWSLLDLPDSIRRAGSAIIDHLDPDGYLRQPLERVASAARPPVSVDDLSAALPEVQHLDPVGVGAREVTECLLLQLDALPGDNRVERTLIEKHLEDLSHNRLPAIARATGFSFGEIQAAVQAMRRSLHLHPGYLVGDRSVPPIRPDVIVEYAHTGAGLTVRLTRGNLPELRISDDVLRMAKTKKNGKETREFARRQVEAASAIIDAVNFRNSRLLEVSKAIVEKQRDFFDVGPTGLKVFRMSDLATELGCDPSTVSRTVADKYMQTPRGIFPLRYFFTGGTESEDGESMGWDRVKNRVSEIIEAEDRKNPLSDDQIAAQLKREGIELSRRTVAKYRQQLDIPAARQRKEF